MKKVIAATVVFFLVALGAYLFRSQMSKLDEEIVYAYYQDNINATRRFDARAICSMYDKNFRAVDISRSPQGESRIAMNRKQACDATRESFEILKKVVKETRAEPDFKYTIESVTISLDRKQATVRMRASMRIGKDFAVNTTGTETLVRRMGRVLSLSSDTKSTILVR
jgi:hypothetical protein